jgi:hypothetical protein
VSRFAIHPPENRSGTVDYSFTCLLVSSRVAIRVNKDVPLIAVGSLAWCDLSFQFGVGKLTFKEDLLKK